MLIEGGYTCVGAEHLLESSVSFLQLSCESKSALKIVVIKKSVFKGWLKLSLIDRDYRKVKINELNLETSK